MALRRQPEKIDKYNLKEFQNLQQNYEIFRSTPSVFLQFDFLNYYQESTGMEIFVLFLNLGDGDWAYIVFDKKKSFGNKTILTCSSFSPYAGLVTNSNSATKIIDAYRILTSYLLNYKQQDEKLQIEIRLPPTQLYPRYEIDQWALWSLKYQITTGYFGRYVNQGNPNVNRNRKRRLRTLSMDFKDSDMQVSDKVNGEVFELMVKNRQLRHGVKLTHSLSDFDFLSGLSEGKFLKVYSLQHESHICAAAIVFRDIEANILQYLGQSECGYLIGSQDLVLSKIIEWSNEENKALLLGTSTRPENHHRDINAGLDSYKSSWGANVYSCYRHTLIS